MVSGPATSSLHRALPRDAPKMKLYSSCLRTARSRSRTGSPSFLLRRNKSISPANAGLRGNGIKPCHPGIQNPLQSAWRGALRAHPSGAPHRPILRFGQALSTTASASDFGDESDKERSASSSNANSLFRVLLLDNVDAVCEDAFQRRGVVTEVAGPMEASELIETLRAYDGVVVRSATKLTEEVLAKVRLYNLFHLLIHNVTISIDKSQAFGFLLGGGRVLWIRLTHPVVGST